MQIIHIDKSTIHLSVTAEAISLSQFQLDEQPSLPQRMMALSFGPEGVSQSAAYGTSSPRRCDDHHSHTVSLKLGMACDVDLMEVGYLRQPRDSYIRLLRPGDSEKKAMVLILEADKNNRFYPTEAHLAKPGKRKELGFSRCIGIFSENMLGLKSTMPQLVALTQVLSSDEAKEKLTVLPDAFLDFAQSLPELYTPRKWAEAAYVAWKACGYKNLPAPLLPK